MNHLFFKEDCNQRFIIVVEARRLNVETCVTARTFNKKAKVKSHEIPSRLVYYPCHVNKRKLSQLLGLSLDRTFGTLL